MPNDSGGKGEDRHPGKVEIGRQFSHYRLVDKLGSGGMGEVYLATDTSLNREVAIKFLPSEFCSDPESRSRFENEARAAAALNHPHIVTVHEVGLLDDRPYYVMEYVSGRSLADLIKSGKLSVDKVLDIGLQVSFGIEEAHRSGIVHRDIKPSNILVDKYEIARILDFGIACTADRVAETQQSTEATISYMAPEIVMGGDPSKASDLFSLGVTLYEALTGKLPFRGEYEASITYSIVNDPVTPVRELRPDVPERFEAVVMRLLEKSPEARYKDASELRSVLEGMSADIESTELSHRSRSRRRRLILPLTAIAIAATALVLSLTFTGGQDSKSSDRTWLAVLPFENLGSPEDEYFVDGVSDAIIFRLAKLNDLGVISRSSSMRYKHSDQPIREIGDELSVSHVVSGTVQWERAENSNLVRINASLIRIDDAKVLWGDSYDVVLGSIFDIQSELAQRITSALQIAISDEYKQAITRRPTYSQEAYNFYLKGNEYFNRSWERHDVEIAIGMYERALEIDPDFACAHAMLSRGHASLFWDSYDRSSERCADAFDHARRSLEIDPELAEGFLALGYCYYHCDGHYDAALDQFHSALRKRPSNAELCNAVAAIHRRTGNLDSSLTYFERALELDPLSHLKAMDISLTFSMMRVFDSAHAYLDRTIMLAPDLTLPYVLSAWLHIIDDGNVKMATDALAAAPSRVNLAESQYYWWISRIVSEDRVEMIRLATPTTRKDTTTYYLFLAQMYRLMGESEAESMYADMARLKLREDFDSLTNDARIHSQLSLAYAGLRDKEKAIHHGEMAMLFLPAARDAFDAPFYMLNLAEVYVILGEQDAAVGQLELLLSIPGFVSVPYLKLDPIWEPLKDHDGFRRLLAIADSTSA